MRGSAGGGIEGGALLKKEEKGEGGEGEKEFAPNYFNNNYGLTIGLTTGVVLWI